MNENVPYFLYEKYNNTIDNNNKHIKMKQFSNIILLILFVNTIEGFQSNYHQRTCPRTRIDINDNDKLNVLTAYSRNKMNAKAQQAVHPHQHPKQSLIEKQPKRGRRRSIFHGDNAMVLPKDDRYLLSDVRREVRYYMKHHINNNNNDSNRSKLLEIVSSMIITILKRKDNRWYDKIMLSSLFYECLNYTWFLNGIVSRNVLSSFISLLLSSTSSSSSSTSSSTINSKSLQYIQINNDKFILEDIDYDTLLYTLLQRTIHDNNGNQHQHQSLLSDKQLHYEWNQVLHCILHQYSNLTLAKQIFILQDTTSNNNNNVPKLSAITYSILIKGCIKHQDSIKYIDYLYQHALDNPDVTIDTIMYNTLLDAYVTLHPTSIQKALDLFHTMPSLNMNTRTYNTILKGYNKFNYKLSESISFIEQMEIETNIFRNDVTINTLVSIAISNQLYNDAQEILIHWYNYSHHSASASKNAKNNHHIHNQHKDHPNIQAYTELINAHVKNNQLQKALDIFYEMQTERFIKPNEHTITVLGNGLAKVGNVKAIWKLIDYARCVSILIAINFI